MGEGSKEEELKHDFTYHPPAEQQVTLYREIRRRALEFGTFLEQHVPASKELEQSIIRLEETVFWANAGIARDL